MAFAVQKLSDGEESSDGEEDHQDLELLTMQKQRSIPPVVVCEFSEEHEHEKIHLEVDGDKIGSL